MGSEEVTASDLAAAVTAEVEEVNPYAAKFELRVTLVWADVADERLVNDLDLELHFGSNFIGMSKILPLDGLEDHMNNVERIIHSNPQQGRYWIKVKKYGNFGSGNGSIQNYAVVATGTFTHLEDRTYDSCSLDNPPPPPSPPPSSPPSPPPSPPRNHLMPTISCYRGCTWPLGIPVYRQSGGNS